MEHVGEVRVAVGEIDVVVALAGDADRLAQLVRAGVDVADHRQRAAERVACVPLGRAHPDGDRGVECLACDVDAVRELAVEHVPAGERGEHAGACLGGRVAVGALDQLERALERLDARPRPVEAPLGARDRLHDQAGAHRVGLGAELGQRRLEQRELAAGVAEGPGGAAGAFEQRHAVGAGALLRVGHAVPQLECALEQRLRLAVRVHALGGRGGADRPLERLGLLAAGGVVVGDRGGQDRAFAFLEPVPQRLGEPQVQGRPLAGQQVVVDDLAQQCVAESVPAVVAGEQDVALDRLAQGVAQRALVEAADLGEHGVLESLADRDDPEDLLRGIGQPLDAQHQRVAQRVRRRSEAVDPGGQELLGEERVAARARPQALQQLGRRRLAEDVLELIGELAVRERLERDATGAWVAFELGQQRAERVAAVQLVGPVGADDEHALVREAVGEEGQRRARRAVGPVQVLDHEQHGPLAAEGVEQGQQAFEQPRLIDPGRAADRRSSRAAAARRRRAPSRSARRRRSGRAGGGRTRAARTAARSRRGRRSRR